MEVLDKVRVGGQQLLRGVGERELRFGSERRLCATSRRAKAASALLLLLLRRLRQDLSQVPSGRCG